MDGGYVEPNYGPMTPCNGCGIPGCGGGCGLGMSGDGFLGGGSDLGSDGEGRPSMIWGGGEYLMWWHKPRGVPPLVTTSPIGTPDTAAGVVGQAGTQFLFGNDEVPNDQASGFRATAGAWLNRYQSFGFGSRYYELDGQGDSFSLASTGNPILARPFFNVDPGINAQDDGTPENDHQRSLFRLPGEGEALSAERAIALGPERRDRLSAAWSANVIDGWIDTSIPPDRGPNCGFS